MKPYPVYPNGKLTIRADAFPVKNPANGEPLARRSAVQGQVSFLTKTLFR